MIYDSFWLLVQKSIRAKSKPCHSKSISIYIYPWYIREGNLFLARSTPKGVHCRGITSVLCFCCGCVEQSTRLHEFPHIIVLASTETHRITTNSIAVAKEKYKSAKRMYTRCTCLMRSHSMCTFFFKNQLIKDRDLISCLCWD